MKQKLTFEVELDEKNMPERIHWSQSPEEQHDTKAILISIFDRKSRDTLKMDLWTKDLQLMEMDRLCYYTLCSMADTYFKATNNESLSNDLRAFAQHFGEKTEIIKKQE